VSTRRISLARDLAEDPFSNIRKSCHLERSV
jgi:hypothetical protein